MAECTRNWVAELALATFPGGEVQMLESRDKLKSIVLLQLRESRSNLRVDPEFGKCATEKTLKQAVQGNF